MFWPMGSGSWSPSFKKKRIVRIHYQMVGGKQVLVTSFKFDMNTIQSLISPFWGRTCLLGMFANCPQQFYREQLLVGTVERWTVTVNNGEQWKVKRSGVCMKRWGEVRSWGVKGGWGRQVKEGSSTQSQLCHGQSATLMRSAGASDIFNRLLSCARPCNSRCSRWPIFHPSQSIFFSSLLRLTWEKTYKVHAETLTWKLESSWTCELPQAITFAHDRLCDP